MRLWFFYLNVTLLLLSTAGCQAFQKDKSGKKTSLLGLRRGDAQRGDMSEEYLDPLGARNSDRLLLDDLTPSQIGTTLSVRGFGGVNQSTAQEKFQQGKQVYQTAVAAKSSANTKNTHADRFEEAANLFRTAASRWPDSKLEEDALFLEGESFFHADRYVQANRAFEKLIANYSGTRYLDTAELRRFAIAQYWLERAELYKGIDFTDPKRPKTGVTAEARRVLHRIRIDDPTGKLADDATMALGKAFFKDKRYYEAADTFEDLRKNYPGSKHQFDAHMLELQARLAGYQGKSYDDTPLRKADELMKSIVRQFPEQAQQQLPYLEKQSGLIRNQLAERDYSQGQYYENRGENRAAKYLYEQVAQKYDGTEFGESISERIAQVEQRPPVPKQHAKWLVDLFPDSEADKPVIQSGDNETLFR